MIDNIVADHLLLSDYRLERWLLRYSQKSGDGSGGGGGGGNSSSLATKVQMEKFGVCGKLHRDHIHTTHNMPPSRGQRTGTGQNVRRHSLHIWAGCECD